MPYRTAQAIGLLAASILLSAPAHADLKDILKAVTESGASTPLNTSAVAPDTLSAGLKEALGKGVQTAIAKLGKDGGYLNNPAVRIAMPDSLAKIDKTLRKLGQDKYADQFVATMNKAAEQAVPEAATVFAEAIRNMTMADAQAILKGPDDAATRYFHDKSAASLSEHLKPIVSAATDQAGVTSAYKKMTKKAGPLASMLGGAEDLDGYVTEQSLDGLFKLIAEEERNIRANPAARTTDLLKQVFGGLLK